MKHTAQLAVMYTHDLTDPDSGVSKVGTVELAVEIDPSAWPDDYDSEIVRSARQFLGENLHRVLAQELVQLYNDLQTNISMTVEES